jgi:hypothetical protein
LSSGQGAPGGEGDGRGATTRSLGHDPLARAVFALLVTACFAAFFITQRLKHTPTAVQDFKLTPRFSPTPAGHIKQEGISFKLAQADVVTVTVIDSNGATVATLVRDHAVARYKQFSLRWNGRRGTTRRYGHIVTPDGRRVLVAEPAGALASPGEYRVGVALRGRGQQVLLPRSFVLVKP